MIGMKRLWLLMVGVNAVMWQSIYECVKGKVGIEQRYARLCCYFTLLFYCQGQGGCHESHPWLLV
jgi:hypothetical protein